MLTFLNPWLWLGAIALGAPLWLHLRRRDREEIVRFAALRFLEDQPVASKSPLQLQNLLLFLLRILALLLIIAGLARPFFPQPSATVSSSHVYILDNTLSRQADKGLERDRDFILAQIRNGGPRDQVAVVEMAYQPKVITGFGDTPAQAEAKLRALQPTTQRGSMLASLRQAEFLLKQSIGETKHITVLSDQQLNQWTENANTPPFLEPGRVTLSAFPASESRPNFYVAEPKLQRAFIGNTAIFQFTSQLGHSGSVNQAVVKLTSNGREILRQPVELDPTTRETTIAARWQTDASVWLQGTISVETSPDDLPQDNVASFSFPPITEGRVAILSESVYVQTALSSTVAKGHWNAQRLSPANLADILKAPPEQDADVLLIDATYLQSSLGRQLVHRYWQNGRGVFIMVGRLSTLANGFLEEMGFSPRPETTEPDTLKPIRHFAGGAAVFKPFTVPDFSNLLEVQIGRHIRMETKGAKPLLFSQEGDGLLYEGNHDKGRYLLSTFAFQRDQTDWVVHPSFVPFMDSALDSLRPQPTLNATLEPGETWLVRIQAEKNPLVAVLHFDGKEVARAQVTPQHRATFRAPDQPGLYSLTYDGDPAVQQMLAVNAPLLESDLRYIQSPPDLLKAWTLSDAPKKNESSAPIVSSSMTDALQQILWWKLLLAGVAALFLEMLILALRREAR